MQVDFKSIEKWRAAVDQEIYISRKAAIARSKVSAPTRWLCENGLIVGDVLHFGCGRAFMDSKLMNSQEAVGSVIDYDANYTSIYSRRPNRNALSMQYDTVVCNYVLNVLPLDARAFTLGQIIGLPWPGGEGKVFITVRSHRAKIKGELEQDGVRTKIGTFQRTFTEEQLVELLGGCFSGGVHVIHNRGEALIAEARHA